MSAGPTKNAPRQAECLRQVASAIKAFDESPTLSELGRRMGISKVSAHLLLRKLEAEGLVSTTDSGWRNVRITPLGAAVVAGTGPPGFHDLEALKLRHPTKP